MEPRLKNKNKQTKSKHECMKDDECSVDEGRREKKASYGERPWITQVCKHKHMKHLSSQKYLFSVCMNGELEEEQVEPGNPVNKPYQQFSSSGVRGEATRLRQSKEAWEGEDRETHYEDSPDRTLELLGDQSAQPTCCNKTLKI